LQLAQAPSPLTIAPPLNILGMIASPQNLTPLEVQHEKQRIEAALTEIQARGMVKLTWLEGQNWRDLQRAMRRGPWHVFHFVGHGGFDRQSDEGVIALTDEEEQAHLLSATQLGRLLADHQSLRLVLLNACEGARGSKQDLFSSMAATLVRRGIPAVLAMQYEITDLAAIELARVFYEALADGMPVDAAVAEARTALSVAVANTVEWGTPVLYMRSPNGVLFHFTPPPVSLPLVSAPTTLPKEIENSIGMKFILIPAGEFLMGSENGDEDEKPIRKVQISKPFYLGKYPVTQGQWQQVMGNNLSRFEGDLSRPVEQVSWEDGQQFLCKLSEREGGKPYRLPTEAEWEYACRAESREAYCFGEDVSQLKEYGWYSENAGGTTHPVGQLKPNAWGLYDVHGNVWEWVQDWYARDYYKQRPNPDRDLQGLDVGKYRVVRGGSWSAQPQNARASSRLWFEPGLRYGRVSFRCAQ
jgi:formylglycine-generating enzyme required for sulfatase activity